MAKTGEDSTKTHRVIKEEEYGLMCQFIADGLWSTSNLVKVVGCDWNAELRAKLQEMKGGK